MDKADCAGASNDCPAEKPTDLLQQSHPNGCDKCDVAWQHDNKPRFEQGQLLSNVHQCHDGLKDQTAATDEFAATIQTSRDGAC